MSESQEMLAQTADDIFSSVANCEFVDGWPVVEEAAFGILLLKEEAGGFGGDWSDFFAVTRSAGQRAVGLPIAEMILGSWFADSAGLTVPTGALSIATVVDGTISGKNFAGQLRHVPWGRHVAYVVCVCEQQVLLIPIDGARIHEAVNPAGDPRDCIDLVSATVQTGPATRNLFLAAALMRVAQIAGALDAALELCIEHVNNRKQFGKPLAKLQAVQQNMAILATEAAAVNSAGQAAANALDRDKAGDGAAFEIAAAKLRANLAVGTSTAIAHQVHGAIGFTEEYPLHRYTRRMMGWRSEYGNDRFWADKIGAHAVGLGGEGLWKDITWRSDVDRCQ